MTNHLAQRWLGLDVQSVFAVERSAITCLQGVRSQSGSPVTVEALDLAVS